jgi:hypothetical protein
MCINAAGGQPWLDIHKVINDVNQTVQLWVYPTWGGEP